MSVRAAGGDFSQWLLIVMRGSEADIQQKLHRLLSPAVYQEPRPLAANIKAASGMDVAVPTTDSPAITAASSSADTEQSRVYAVKLQHGIQSLLASVAAVQADTSGR